MPGPNTVFASCAGSAVVFPTSGTWIQLDYLKTGPVAVQSVISTSGAGTHKYSVEWSLDAPSTSSGATTWYASGSSQNSSNSYYSFTYPIRSLRINLTAATSNTLVTTVVAQSAQ